MIHDFKTLEEYELHMQKLNSANLAAKASRFIFGNLYVESVTASCVVKFEMEKMIPRIKDLYERDDYFYDYMFKRK